MSQGDHTTQIETLIEEVRMLKEQQQKDREENIRKETEAQVLARISQRRSELLRWLISAVFVPLGTAVIGGVVAYYLAR